MEAGTTAGQGGPGITRQHLGPPECHHCPLGHVKLHKYLGAPKQGEGPEAWLGVGVWALDELTEPARSHTAWPHRPCSHLGPASILSTPTVVLDVA